MTVSIKYGIDKDRRPDLNTDNTKARYYITPIVRVNFIDDNTGNILFTFVPTLKHELEINKAFQLLKAYDQLRTTLMEFILNNQINQPNKPRIEIKENCGEVKQ